MKYCLDSRCADNYLEKADSIKVQWRDRTTIYDLVEKFPEAEIVLQFIITQMQEEFDWHEIQGYNDICQGRLVCAMPSYELCEECKNRGIKFYYGFPVTSFWELEGLKNLGVCYVRLGVDLFFQMNAVKKIGVPVRAIANVAYNDGLPHRDGICGQWIRSEDVDLYKDYVDVIEFEDANPRKEEALFRVYAEHQYWTGNLNPLITNLNFDATSRLISPKITEARLNCRHVCASGGSCQICRRAFELAQPEKIRNYIAETSKD
jgi:hypothetical protein